LSANGEKIEDLLAERGIMVSYETVRRWVNHFGPKIAADLRKCRPKPQWPCGGIKLMRKLLKKYAFAADVDPPVDIEAFIRQHVYKPEYKALV
jgi:hypothetical protein